MLSVFLFLIWGWVFHVHALVGDEPEEWEKWRTTFETKVLPIIQAKCLKCHQGDAPEGELDLSRFADGNKAREGADIWERVAKRVRLNEMPPPKSPSLNDRDKSTFHRWVDSMPGQDLCSKLASDETQSWYRGNVMSRRLSQYEYSNAIRDLLGFKTPEEYLPPSDGAGGEGFDTFGDSLFTSPIHLESYVRIADLAIDRALTNQDEHEINRWLSQNAAYMRIAVPLSESEYSVRSAAESTIRRFAKLSWRRPVLASEVRRLLELFDRSQQNGLKYTQSLAQPLKAILLSPHFLFLAEPEPDSAGVQRLTSHQFATRMAMFLWSSIPDETLLSLADSDVLFEPDIIRQQMHRMLADEKSRSLGENFGLQWLGLRDFALSKPDISIFPEYSQQWAEDAVEETIRFISQVFRTDRPLTELIDSDYLIVNQRMAKHYGVTSVAKAEEWTQLQLPAELSRKRGGVLTMASVLTKTSYPRRTSPVLRGRWVLEELLGSKIPEPPPNVPPLDERERAADSLTMRQRLEVHRQKAECASCHDRMDPIGFGLENFDAAGRWRNEDAGAKIDSEGSLPSGEHFTGPEQLKEILLNRKAEFYSHVAKKLTGFALGRELNKFDQCIIDKSVKRLMQENRSSVVLEEILLSYPFQHRYYNPAKSK